MLSEPVKALFESNTNARHAGDADRLAKEHKPNGVHVLTDLPYGIPDQLRKLDLYRPETQHEPLPVIIDFHGGGLYHGDKQNTMCRDMYLAKYGFAVVNANYRLVRKLDSKANYTMRLTQLSGRMSTRMTMAWIRMLCF